MVTAKMHGTLVVFTAFESGETSLRVAQLRDALLVISVDDVQTTIAVCRET